MKKLLTLAVMLFLAACGNKDLSQDITECTYPDVPSKQAPLWICGAKVEGVEVSAVGSTKKSAAGFNFMQQQATANARVTLAQQISSDIQSMVKNYTETTGNGTSETVDQVNSLVSKQITNQNLRGTRVYKQSTSPSGTLYVLVGVDKKLYEGFVQTTLNTSFNNDQAQWQKFMSKQSFEEMKKDIDGQIKSGN